MISAPLIEANRRLKIGVRFQIYLPVSHFQGRALDVVYQFTAQSPPPEWLVQIQLLQFTAVRQLRKLRQPNSADQLLD